jgi:hypothetical protein
MRRAIYHHGVDLYSSRLDNGKAMLISFGLKTLLLVVRGPAPSWLRILTLLLSLWLGVLMFSLVALGSSLVIIELGCCGLLDGHTFLLFCLKVIGQ